jgi:hypothetical protein
MMNDTFVTAGGAGSVVDVIRDVLEGGPTWGNADVKDGTVAEGLRAQKSRLEDLEAVASGQRVAKWLRRRVRRLSRR